MDYDFLDVNSMYPNILTMCPTNILEELTFEQVLDDIRYSTCVKYKIPIEQLKEVNTMGYDKPNYGEEGNDIHFLFETEKWNGTKLDAMTSSHIINCLLMLLRNSTKYKQNYELFVIDNQNNTLLKPIHKIEDLVKLDSNVWVMTTPIYVAFIKELDKRNLLDYFSIVKDRLENENSTEN